MEVLYFSLCAKKTREGHKFLYLKNRRKKKGKQTEQKQLSLLLISTLADFIYFLPFRETLTSDTMSKFDSPCTTIPTKFILAYVYVSARMYLPT